MNDTQINAPIEIIDIIAHRSQYSSRDQYFVVANRSPRWVYRREGQMFIAQDGDFFDFLSGNERVGEAFGGRVFDIAIVDGSTFTCRGNVWACAASQGFQEVVSVGASGIADLDKCYVFRSASMSKEALSKWLENNTPSRHYYKYDKRYTHEWAFKNLRSYGWIICKKRARAMQRNGRHPWLSEDGKWMWSRSYERRLAEIAEMGN